MAPILYFAYGSNMLKQRLVKRCKSAHAVGSAWAEGYALSFSKQSKDRSGKATLVKSDNAASRVYGVLFDIDPADLPALHREEGKGYERIANFPVQRGDGDKPLDVFTYIASADRTDPALLPYDWYLSLIIAGAERANLPENYVQALRAEKSMPDSDPDRASHVEALALLKAVGYMK